MTNMMKRIKQGENIGVAIQVQGAVVKIYPHPRFKDMYRFFHKGKLWTCSDYAFDKEYKSEVD